MWPGFIPGRVQCSRVRSGPGGPWARWKDAWVDLLPDDCVPPEAEQLRSWRVEQVSERLLGEVVYFILHGL